MKLDAIDLRILDELQRDGALSNVEYTIRVTDTLTGQTNTYTNPSGRFASVADTGAF